MDLAGYSKPHGDFYVPAFVVKVGGTALTEGLGIGVSQCEVDLTLSAAGRFSFTVVNTFSAKDRKFLSALGQPVLEILTFGASVEIRMGYGDRSRLPVLLKGLITEITTSFSEGATPELVVSGYDQSVSADARQDVAQLGANQGQRRREQDCATLQPRDRHPATRKSSRRRSSRTRRATSSS